MNTTTTTTATPTAGSIQRQMVRNDNMVKVRGMFTRFMFGIPEIVSTVFFIIFASLSVAGVQEKDENKKKDLAKTIGEVSKATPLVVMILFILKTLIMVATGRGAIGTRIGDMIDYLEFILIFIIGYIADPKSDNLNGNFISILTVSYVALAIQAMSRIGFINCTVI